MKQSQAWLLQIDSDWAAAEFLSKQAVKHPNLRCQVMAKYQQVAEKSIKVMVAAVNELGTATFTTITSKHIPAAEIRALSGLKRLIDNTSIDHLKNKVLTTEKIKQIDALCRLSPEYPEAGKPFLKNTEYPFNLSETALDDWTAPAVPDTFTEAELQTAYQLVWVLRLQVQRFVSGVGRGSQQK